MADTLLGLTKIRRPDFTDSRWDVPLNENWEAIASMLGTLVSGFRWVDGLGITLTGGLGFTVALGNIDKGAGPLAVVAASLSVPDGTTTYVYVDSGNLIKIGATLNVAGIVPLYMLRASSGVIISAGDLRHLQVASGGGGGLTSEYKSGSFTAESGKRYLIDTSGAPVTVTFPALPADGEEFAIKDYANSFDVNACSADPNGNNIEQEGSGVMTLGGRGYACMFVFWTDRWLIAESSPLPIA